MVQKTQRRHRLWLSLDPAQREELVKMAEDRGVSLVCVIRDVLAGATGIPNRLPRTNANDINGRRRSAKYPPQK